MKNRLIPFTLLVLVIAAAGFAQTKPTIDLSRYGIELTEDQKARIIADLRAASPWIPADSTVGLKLEIGLAITDNVGKPFVDDPALIGAWKSVDYVSDPDFYEPGVKKAPFGLFWTGLRVIKGGKCEVTMGQNPPSPWAWTKGSVLTSNMAQAYDIRTIKGKPVLFVEWKSGDYSMGGAKPAYYVFTK